MTAFANNSFVDEQYMQRALELAKRGLYTTDPNPRVGCVIVKNGQIIAEGWHVRAGEAHAEIHALNQLQTSSEGATVYVSLEPCSHYGKTPPCCEALIRARVARVVVAMQDPNPLVSGQGLQCLEKAGISISCGILQAQAQQLNRGFIQRMTLNRPWMCSKAAISLDGRTALANGESQWISCAESRADVQKLRAQSSAILTGIGTVLADDPRLTVRLETDFVAPIRIILDSQLRISPQAKLFSTAETIWILTGINQIEKIAQLTDKGAKVILLPLINQRLDLQAVVNYLANQQINQVLIEAGAQLNGALLNADLIDEWIIYMAACFLGDQGRGLVQLPDLTQLTDRKIFQWQHYESIGIDLKLTLSRLFF
ncbi:MAG: hypothetical protein RL637_1833 [Pseudomonadota bacterium]|jgi:diaminohydroxyphosphoribosylaminopyrimidine deaminase/5-amino-6-(5-phosphoribosylamino)uracil reductase